MSSPGKSQNNNAEQLSQSSLHSISLSNSLPPRRGSSSTLRSLSLKTRQSCLLDDAETNIYDKNDNSESSTTESLIPLSALCKPISGSSRTMVGGMFNEKRHSQDYQANGSARPPLLSKGGSDIIAKYKKAKRAPYKALRILFGTSSTHDFSKINVGLSLMVLNAFLSSVRGMSIKMLTVLSTPYPTFELVFVRSIVGFLICAAVQKLYHKSNHVLLGPPGTRLLVIIRSVVGFLAVSAYFLSIRHLSVVEATVLSFTGPLFVGILGRLILKEKWEIVDALSAIVSLGGVAIIAKPSLVNFILHEPEKTTMILRVVRDMATVPSSQHILSICVGIFAAFIGAFSMIVLRRIGKQVAAAQVLVTLNLVSIVLSVPGSLALNNTVNVLSVLPTSITEAVLLVIVMPLTTLLMQICVSRALQVQTASKCSSMNFLQIVCSFLLEFIVLRKVPRPSDYIGGGIIVTCAVLVSIAHLRKDQAEKNKKIAQVSTRA